MELVELGGIFKISSGGTPSRKKNEYYENGTIAWVKTGDLKPKYIDESLDYITEEALNNSSAKLFPPKTVLIAMYGATIGATSILNIEASTNQACAAFLPSDKCTSEYLYYFFKLNKSQIIRMGVGGAQPNISAGILKRVKIPLPPLDTQKKIAAILDEADRLRQLNKQLIETYDALTQSLFLEMFGDPVTNPKGWEIFILNKLVTKLGDGLHGTPNYSENGDYFFINGNNLIEGKIVIYEKTKKINHGEYLRIKKDLNKSTMFVSINGTIGKVAFYNGEKVALGKSVCYFNVRENLINKTFLYYIFNCGYFVHYTRGNVTGSTIKNVSLKSMRNFPILLPPIHLQNQFAERVQIIEQQKQQAQHSLKKSEDLFNSLLQKAFKGKLV